MAEKMLPLAPSIQVSVNGTRLGMLQSCQERTLADLRLVGAVGTKGLSAILPTKRRYRITFRQLKVAPDYFSHAVDLHGLSNFSVSISDGHTTVTYSGCEFSALTTRCDVDGLCIEEAEICALQRAAVV